MADAVEEFYATVNARAEAAILAGDPITGAHHRSLEAEIARHRAARAAPPASHREGERLAELEACLIFAEGETRDATQVEAHARALEIVRAAREAARGEG